jgi:hypothetical protein
MNAFIPESGAKIAIGALAVNFTCQLRAIELSAQDIQDRGQLQ